MRDANADDAKALQRLIDRADIQDAMARYSRGVDRSDWDLVRSAYHADAYDDHGGYKGGVTGLIAWLEDRFAGVEDGVHFLGNFMVEFTDADTALVETYFISHRLEGESAGPERSCRQAWGRYVDRFERRLGAWRVARRTVVLDSVIAVPAKAAARMAPSIWGRRNRQDPVYQAAADTAPGAPR